MITITISCWSILIVVLIGFAISFFSAWLVEKIIHKEDMWGIGFSSGWECGTEYAKKKAEESE